MISYNGISIPLEDLVFNLAFYVSGFVLFAIFSMLAGAIYFIGDIVESKYIKFSSKIVFWFIPSTMVVLIICSIILNFIIKSEPAINHSCNIDISKLKCYQENYVICEDCMKSFKTEK
jgi:hypothetical protein